MYKENEREIRFRDTGGKEMSFGSGYDFNDVLDDLIYPNSKWDAIKYGVITFITYPIIALSIIPLSYTISFILGLCSDGKNQCDKCNKEYVFNHRTSHKFYNFCEKCNDEYSDLVSKFLKEIKSEEKGK